MIQNRASLTCQYVADAISLPQDGSPPTSSGLSVFPSKIWQSWKDDAENPTDRTVGFPHEWRAMNPKWRYERITDDNMNAYVESRIGAPISAVFNNISDSILKADFIRYLILLREGGLWVDVDVRPRQPISDWIPEQYREADVNLVVGIENDHNKEPIWPGSPYSVQLCQYSVLAKPQHPALKTLVSQVTANIEHLLASEDRIVRCRLRRS